MSSTSAGPAGADQSSPRASRLLLIAPFAVGLVLVIVYFFVWNWAAGVMREEIAAWKDTQIAAGYTVEHDEISVEGFPFFLRARIPNPRYGNEVLGWSWQAETLYTDTSPFSPTRIILSPLGEQTVFYESDAGRQEWDVEADTFRISLSEQKTGLDLKNLVATPVSQLDISRISIGSVIANTEITDNPENDRQADLGRLSLSGRNIVVENGNGTLPLAFSEIDLSLAATGLRAVLNRHPGESDVTAWQRGNGELYINGLRMVVSDGRQGIPSQMRVNGVLRIDDQAYPEGKLNLAVKDHRALLSVLNGRGVLSGDEAQQADVALQMLGGSRGEEIETPLQLRGGKLRLGPIAIMDLEQVG